MTRLKTLALGLRTLDTCTARPVPKRAEERTGSLPEAPCREDGAGADAEDG